MRVLIMTVFSLTSALAVVTGAEGSDDDSFPVHRF